MKIGRIQNQIINNNLVRNVKKVVKPAVLATTLTLGGLAAGGCGTKYEKEPHFNCGGCDYVVYPGTDLNVANETLYKLFESEESGYKKDMIMESAALLEIADKNGDEIISREEILNSKGWFFDYYRDNTMSLYYMDYEINNPHTPGIRVNMSQDDFKKCKIDNNEFIFDDILRISKQGEILVDIKKSGSGYEVEISHDSDNVIRPEPSYIRILGNDVKYLKISNTRITSIGIDDRTKDLNIDLIDVKGEKLFSPIKIYKNNTKSHININTIDSKYKFMAID